MRIGMDVSRYRLVQVCIHSYDNRGRSLKVWRFVGVLTYCTYVHEAIEVWRCGILNLVGVYAQVFVTRYQAVQACKHVGVSACKLCMRMYRHGSTEVSTCAGLYTLVWQSMQEFQGMEDCSRVGVLRVCA
jgi:hypothetical protein